MLYLKKYEVKKIICYCDKWGNLGDEYDKECYCCGNSPLKPIPREYIDNFRWRDGDGKQAFIEDVVKKSPNLDQYLFEHKDEIIQAKNDDMNAKMAIGREVLNEQTNVPKCHTCGSTNVEKISITKKAFGGAMFGLFSADVRNTMLCKHCGCKW